MKKRSRPKTIVLAPVGRAKKQSRQKSSGRRKSMFSSSGPMTAVIAVLAHRFLSNLVSQYASTSPILNTVPYAAPLLIYFLANRGIIPVPGLDTVSLTILVKEISDDLLKSTSLPTAATPAQGFLQDMGRARARGAIIDYPRSVDSTLSMIQMYNP